MFLIPLQLLLQYGECENDTEYREAQDVGVTGAMVKCGTGPERNGERKHPAPALCNPLTATGVDFGTLIQVNHVS